MNKSAFTKYLCVSSNGISGEMVTMLAAVYHGFGAWSGEIKDNQMDICCFYIKKMKFNTQRNTKMP
jgi:hypothetical protein